MKYNRIFIGAAICFGIVHSCQEPEQEIALDGSKVVFVASVEETRVSISDDYRTLSWSAGDEISVLDGTSNVLYSTSDEGTSVKFTSQAGISDEAGEVYAVYPYDAESRLTENGLQVTVPHQQSVADPGFDASSVLAIAYSSELSSETYLDFKHLCSYFKFTVPSEDNVTEVILRGGEKEYIAGKVNVTFEKGVPVCSVVDGINEIVFRSETPMNGTYIVPLLPCVLQEGLAVTLKSKDGRSAVHNAGIGLLARGYKLLQYGVYLLHTALSIGQRLRNIGICADQALSLALGITIANLVNLEILDTPLLRTQTAGTLVIQDLDNIGDNSPVVHKAILLRGDSEGHSIGIVGGNLHLVDIPLATQIR